MTSRERFEAALARRPADRIPIDFWASRGAIRSLTRAFGLSYEDFLDRYDVDLRYIPGPRYIGPPLAPGCDLWGVRRTTVRLDLPHGTEEYEELLEPPLAAAETPADLDAHSWPSPDDFDYSGIADQCDAVHASGRVAVFMGDRMNRVAQLKPAMYLRGVETIFLDLALNPDLAAALIGRVRSFFLGYLERILQAARGKLDVVLTGDDFGAQNGLLLSPETWREFLAPGFHAYMALAHAHGARTMHHTCGAVAELIPDLIAGGLDILQSLQPDAAGMDFPRLVRTFGDRLAFQGGISVQQTLPRGSPADVRAAVRQVADTVRGRGGYIFCTAHNLQADTPPENIRALMDAYHEFG
jgi:uroporphyrinogen decarboxylase